MPGKNGVRPPLRLCEAAGPTGWLRAFSAPDQILPSYQRIQKSAYEGLFRTFIVGRSRCIDERDMPDFLRAFGLAPAVETEAAA